MRGKGLFKYYPRLGPCGGAPVRSLLSAALVIFCAPLAALNAGSVQNAPAEPVYSVVSPVGESTVKMIAMAPRLNTLGGQTVCMVSNVSFKADIVLPVIGDQLKQIYPNVRIVPHTQMPVAPSLSTPDAPQKDAENLRGALKAKGCSVVVAGNGG